MKNERDLKIAIVHDFLVKIGGAEKVLLEIHKIFPDAPIYTLIYSESGTKRQFAGKDFDIIPSALQKLPAIIRNRPKLLLARFPQAIEEFDLSKFDIVISSSNSYAHGVITKPKTLHVSYCYSPMRYIWDWHHQYLLENNIGYGFMSMQLRKVLSRIRIWDRAAADRVDTWIAISKTVQKRIKKYYKQDSNVIYSPVDIEKIKISEKKPENFYLVVSRLSPYKKIDLAIEAFNKLGKKLIIVGEGSDLDRLKSLAKENITFLGWQSDQTVSELMSRAKALIFPGEEDFGLTPIESMAAGRPVIAYNKGGVTETVVEGKTGLFFDDASPESLVDAVERFELSFDQFSPLDCRKQAENFSSSKFQKDFKQTVTEEYEKYQIMMGKK